jgi:hypothetical protein
MNGPGEDAPPGRWPRPPLWLVVTLALLLMVATALVSIVGPVVVENWTVERLRERPDVAFYWGSGEVSWSTGLITEIRKPTRRQIELKADFPRDLLPLLTRIRHVKSLGFAGRHFRDEDLAICRRLPVLENVWLTDVSFSADGYRHLEGLTFDYLSLSNMTIPAGALATISKLPRLKYFLTFDSTYAESDFASFQSHPALEWMILENNPPSSRLNLSATDLETIGSMPALEIVNLKFAGVANEELSHLPSTMRLKKLNLRGKEITDEGLAGLQVDPEVLWVCGTSITFGPSTETWLRSRKRCRKINVTFQGISPERIQYLNTLGPAQLYEDDQSPGGGLPSP